jgi:hypothetical protein
LQRLFSYSSFAQQPPIFNKRAWAIRGMLKKRRGQNVQTSQNEKYLRFPLNSRCFLLTLGVSLTQTELNSTIFKPEMNAFLSCASQTEC